MDGADVPDLLAGPARRSSRRRFRPQDCGAAPVRVDRVAESGADRGEGAPLATVGFDRHVVSLAKFGLERMTRARAGCAKSSCVNRGEAATIAANGSDASIRRRRNAELRSG